MARIIKKVKKELVNAPEGRLRVGKCQGCYQYFQRKKADDTTGIYLSKNEIDLVKRLAQKSYNEKILKYAEKTYSMITNLLQTYEEEKIEQIYYSQTINRQQLTVPVEETFEQKLEKWVSQPHVGNIFNENTPVITTNNGIRVRSKSEKIIADYFESKGIAYKYECPLFLNPVGMVYPDFTFLSRKTGKEIYWEHAGLMDNPEYADSAVKKIRLYVKNGIFPGENLILTFETSKTIINNENIKLLTEKYLL